MIFLWGLLAGSVHTPRDLYIEKYKDLAIIEMERKGIPASIKLAQAILESQSGTSSFASNSNNHFGIKCKSTWTGNTYYHKDDDLDEHGTLVPSCFRSYGSVIDSYVDHSNFLADRKYYTKLWAIPTTDYKAWAHGLKSCGYATDPDYAEKLISIIEREELFRFDTMSSSELRMQARTNKPILRKVSGILNLFTKFLLESK